MYNICIGETNNNIIITYNNESFTSEIRNQCVNNL